MPQKPIRILIAEDSATIRRFIEQALIATHRPCDITQVADGEEAVRLLAKTAFDIAFVDINMPHFSGVEVLAAVNVMQYDTLCVSMSSRLDASTAEKLKGFGAYDFLAKPFTPEQVKQVVEMWELITTPFDVMVVDDSAVVRKIVSKVIQGSIFKLNVTEADNGPCAIAAAAYQSFRLIFTDFNMPGMTGLELAGEITRVSRDSQVVLMSTEFSPTLDKAAKAVGAKAFLRKPFFAEDVDSVLHNLFGLQSPRFSKQVRLFASM